MLMFSKSGFATTKKSKIPCIIRLDMHELFNPGCLFQAQLQISTQKRQLSNWANEWTRKSIENHDILPPWSYLSIFICPMYFHATSFKRPLPHEYPITWPWKQLLPQESIRLVGKSLQYLNTLVGGPWKKCRINVWHWLFSRLSDGYIWVAQCVFFSVFRQAAEWELSKKHLAIEKQTPCENPATKIVIEKRDVIPAFQKKESIARYSQPIYSFPKRSIFYHDFLKVSKEWCPQIFWALKLTKALFAM